MRTIALFGVVLVVAAFDWVAVARELRRVEVIAKPLTMIMLMVATVLTVGAGTAPSRWLLAGLVLSLAGDIFLLAETQGSFVSGLASFLLAHVAYIGAFLAAGVEPAPGAAGLVLAAAAVATIGRRIVGAVRTAEPALTGPVVAYIAVISAMVAAAFGRARWAAIAGAVSFYGSDALIAWTRFVTPIRHGRPAIMVTYHLGQVLIVTSFL